MCMCARVCVYLCALILHARCSVCRRSVFDTFSKVVECCQVEMEGRPRVKGTGQRAARRLCIISSHLRHAFRLLIKEKPVLALASIHATPARPVYTHTNIANISPQFNELFSKALIPREALGARAAGGRMNHDA